MEITVATGHFAKKQLLSPSRLIAWSHTRRFQMGLELAGNVENQRILDFGCGDATFLSMLLSSGQKPLEATGAEIDPRVIQDNRQRLAHQPLLQFVHQSDLTQPRFARHYDLVVCMEVCEHLVDPAAALALFHSVLKPNGRILVSVPVETGLPIAIKQCARRIAGWRKIGDYQYNARYSWSEWARSLFARHSQHIVRPVHHHLDGSPFHDHKGFNWRVLAGLIRQRFRIDAIHASPVRWLPPDLNSQAWFCATKVEPGPSNSRARE